MKIKHFLTVLLLFCFTTTFGQDKKVLDDFILKLNPEGYSSYKQSEAILQQSSLLADEFSARLSNFQNLVVTLDPQVLLNDFNQKMLEIEKIDSEFKQQFNAQTINQSANAINSISSGDMWGAGFSALGALGSANQQRQAAQELERKRQELQASKNNQMSKIYWKAQDFNIAQKNDFLKAAAYAEYKQDEQYNIAFADNIECYSMSMKQNFNTYNSSWLINNCPKPVKNNDIPLENKFVTKDVQYSKIAEHKFNLYKQTKHEDFRESAISYAASAAKIKPSAKYFAQIADYYHESSTVLALSNYLAANYYDVNFLNTEQKQRIEELKGNAEIEISAAISKNQQDYLDAFIKTGLDKVIKINDRTILNHAIKMDKPNSVQLILNHYVEGLEQIELTSRLQKVIMLCAANNSVATLQRFIELGVSADFILNGYAPIDVAAQYGNEKAFNFLLQNSEKKSKYETKYANSEIFARSKAIENERIIKENNRIIAENPKYIINDYLMSITNTSSIEDAKKKLLTVIDITTEAEETYKNDIQNSKSLLTFTLTKQKYPNLFYSKNKGKYTKEFYFNGNDGVNVIKNLKFPLSENEKLIEKYKNQMHIELFYDEMGYKLNYLGTETINGKECKKIEVISPIDGSSKAFHYFDINNKLKIASVESIAANLINVILYYDNYISVDGILFSFSQKKVMKSNYINSIEDIQIKSIKLNTNIPVSNFQK